MWQDEITVAFRYDTSDNHAIVMQQTVANRNLYGDLLRALLVVLVNTMFRINFRSAEYKK